MTFARQGAPRFLLTQCLLLVSSLMLTACIAPDDTSTVVSEHSTVAAARTEMKGLSETELRMCAGFPDATSEHGEDGKILSFRRSTPRGNASLVLPATNFGMLPAVGGGVNVAPSGYCHTQVRILDGKVAQVEFSGDNNRSSSLNALCATMVDSCVAYARRK